MQNSQDLAVDRGTGKPHAQAKRKLSRQQFVAAESSTPQSRQQTLSELFSPSAQKRCPSDPNELESSPASKRLKRTSSFLGSNPRTTHAEVIPPEKMYHFAPSSSKAKDVIDLTSTPSPGPSKSRANGAMRPSNFTPHTGAKKLVVKNLRKTPRINPELYFSQVWDQLDSALTAIFNNEKVPCSLEELYRGVENLCRQDRATELNKRLTARCSDYVSTRLKQPLTAKTNVGKDVDVLRAVLAAWSKWNSQLITIRSIFFYMDRSYLLHSTTYPSINDMGLIQFRTHIFSDTILKSKIVRGTCDLIDYDRRGVEDQLDPSTFRRAIGMFHDLAIYTKEFEPKMLSLSQTYFNNWAVEESESQSLAVYVEESHKLINREMTRCDLFNLDGTTRRELLNELEDILIDERKGFLVETDSVSKLLEANATSSLEQLYLLLERLRLGSKLRAPFESFIITQGSSIVFDQERESEMVVRLLSFKKRLDTIWKVSFHRHEGLGHSLREAFENFINKSKKTSSNWNTDNAKPGEMIAKYVDMLLRGGAKAIPTALSSADKGGLRDDDDADGTIGDEDAEINSQLDQVLDLFRFVHGKAVFEAFYKKDLARRLLMGRSASADAERSMLARLKTECGAGFTHNLEQMFKDVDLARDEMSSYKTYMEGKHKKTALDLNVNVLSASSWPTYPDIPVNMPSDILQAINDFDSHYKSKHTGRKLQWKHSLAHCQLKANFPKGNKEIVVSSFQTIVLLLFNDVDPRHHVGYKDIRAATGLSDVELKRTLQSLACAKYRPLLKHPKGREVNESDTFTINLTFSDAKYRIKINQIQLKETKEENKETHERVAQDRHYETQAAIVRIMKSRKTIKHAELVAEVIKATKTRGVLDPADIKKNIEKLIEKDYMEREEGTDKLYITHSEWASEDAYSASAGSGVSKRAPGANFRRLPFNFCAVSLQPFSHPVCTADGTIFDLTNILPWLKKHGTNPVNGTPLKSSELIKLNFAKNDEGEMVDPVTFKVFTDNTHIVALKNTGNAFAWDTIERLNIKPKMWKDLVTDADFSRADIITLQDPQNVAARDLSSFKYLKDGVSTLTEEQEAERSDPTRNVNLDAMGSAAKVLKAKEAVARARAQRGEDPNRSLAGKSGALSKRNGTASGSPSTRMVKSVPYNAAQHTTGKAAASFTSTGLTPHTSGERALLTDEEYMLKPRRVKIKGYARMQTTHGDLNIELHTEYAPKAVWNFIQLAKKGYYDGVAFHRSIRNFMIQGGDPTGTGKGGTSIWGKNFNDELEGPLAHNARGIVSMANKGKHTNSSQFFITYRAAPHLNNKHTIFGSLTSTPSNETTLKALEALPTDPTSARPLEDAHIISVAIYIDPFEEFQARKRESDDRERERDEIKRKGGTDDDRTTWTGKRIRPAGAGAGAGGGGGGGDGAAGDESEHGPKIGKYIGGGGGGDNDKDNDTNEAISRDQSRSRRGDADDEIVGEWLDDDEGSMLPPPAKKAKSSGAAAGGFGNFDSW
ncbi:MAG: hypothetical protein M1819_000371 [Sarea resinae]|nr:MAG: hypothetical protein M1819_000371 [Sarea resinae]